MTTPVPVLRAALAVLVLAWPAATFPAGPARTVAITIDDLPFMGYGLALKGIQDETMRLLSALKRHRVPAIGFVNEDKLEVPGEVDARVALLQGWLDAGMELGNHGYGHVDLNSTPLERYQEAVLKGEVVTRRILARRGAQPRYYRHPFTHTGPTREAKAAFEAFLAAHGYAVAPFTVEDSDYLFAKACADARRAGNTALAEKLRAAYLDHQDAMFTFYEAEARDLFGRDIPQILLIHANELNARAMEDVLGRLRRRGYAFVSLDAALRDEAYRSADGYVGPVGPSWLHRWRAGRGGDIQAALRREPDPPGWVVGLVQPRERP
jgi:peptidoglycan/xylan/chitin deacetylase (PgdA/CDA1 family)